MKLFPCSLVILAAEAARTRHSSLAALSGETLGGLAPECRCSEDGVVGPNKVDTNTPGCKMHFGQRFGYLCYINGGEECAGARLSSRHGVYWRACPEEQKAQEATDRLLMVLEGIDKELIESRMAEAEAKGVPQAALDQAAQRLLEIDRMMELKTELFEALEGFSHDELKAKAEKAEKVELFEFLPANTQTKIQNRLHFLKTAGEKEHALRTAIAGTDLGALQSALAACQAVKGDPDLIAQGEAAVAVMLEKLQAVEDALEAAKTSSDPEEIDAAVANAKAHKVGNKDTYSELKTRKQYLACLEMNNLHELIRQHNKYKNQFPDLAPKVEQQVSKTRKYYHNIKVELKKMVQTGTDAAAIRAAADNCKELRAASNELLAQAYARAAELER